MPEQSARCAYQPPALRHPYSSRVNLFGVFPISFAPNGNHGEAHSDRCANEQGEFWEYHDLLFTNQQALLPKDLRRHADTLGVNLGKFDICIGTGKYQKSIALNMDDHPVEVTPIFPINGRVVQGGKEEELVAAIEQELERGGN